MHNHPVTPTRNLRIPTRSPESDTLSDDLATSAREVMNAEAAEYEIGYAKPSREHQFKKGQSGNPKGRPKRSENQESFGQLVREALDEKVVVTENGKRRRISKFEAALTQLVDKAAEGDLRAFRDFIRLQANLTHEKPKTKREVIVETVMDSDLQQERQSVMSAQASEYALGDGRPPEQHPFKSGQSGNKKGRPKAKESPDQIAKRVFNAPVAICENGKRRTISKQELVLKRLTDKAVAGDPGAIGEVVKLKRCAQQTANDNNPLIIQLVQF